MTHEQEATPIHRADVLQAFRATLKELFQLKVLNQAGTHAAMVVLETWIKHLGVDVTSRGSDGDGS